MSKLVVDQIQKSGGGILTLPSTSAGADNSLLVSDLGGNLGFSTLGNLLPSGIQGSVLSNDGSGNLSFEASPLVPQDSPLIIGTVASSSARGNPYSTGGWTTSGPNSTFQNATAAGTTAQYTHQAWNMFLGDGYPNASGNTLFYSHDYAGEYNRDIHYASNNRVGDVERTWFYYYNQTGYGGVTFRVLPIRNTTNSAISTTVYFGYSSYDTYNGAACGTYTPSNDGSVELGSEYSKVTGGTWTQGFTNTTNAQTSSSMSVSVPANTTVLVMLITSHNYQTTYYFDETSNFFNLSTTFKTGLVCDLRMLNALATARSPSATNALSYPNEIYTACASMYGDR